MDAQELAEWIAYYQTEDKETLKQLNYIIADEKEDSEKNNDVRNILNMFTTKKK